MLEALGHTVFLYAAEGSNAPCTEFIPIISERQRVALLSGPHYSKVCEYQHADMEPNRLLWQASNPVASAEIQMRKKPGDFLLSLGGESQFAVFDYHSDLLAVEYSIGYPGNFCAHRVFESYAWMHYCYGYQANKINAVRFFDTVIPLFFDPAEFPFVEEPEDYLLYVGRITQRKGVSIARDIALKLGMKLKIIGHGAFEGVDTSQCELLGPVDNKTRNEVMSKARALICPSWYFEPFGAVAVEAQLCGTPVICTNAGGYTETVEHGGTGYRCNYMGEFLRAARLVDSLDRRYIRKRAQQKYSMWNLMHDFEAYFHRVALRMKDGWNSEDEGPANTVFGWTRPTNRITSGGCSSLEALGPVHNGS